MKNERAIYHTAEAAGNEVIGYTAGSDFNSVAVNLTNFDGKWVFQATRSTTGGNPKITIQCSGDGSNWRSYKNLSTNVPIPEVVIDDEFLPRFFRVAYTAGGAGGTITFKLYLE